MALGTFEFLIDLVFYVIKVLMCSLMFLVGWIPNSNLQTVLLHMNVKQPAKSCIGLVLQAISKLTVRSLVSMI